MGGMTQEQRVAILTKAEALAGEPLGEAGALLAEIACERALAHCNRSDIPEEMEQAVAAVPTVLLSSDNCQPVKRQPSSGMPLVVLVAACAV